MARGAGGRERGGGLPAGAEQLRALPPDRFTAERNALAARLAEAGDAAGAAEVRRLRRPVGLAWVLNRLAQARPGEIAALLDAGDRLRAGQRRALSGGGAATLREAEEALRGAARALRVEAHTLLEEAGRRADPAALGRVELLLRVAATAPGEAREALRRGVLEREPEIAGGDLSGLGLVAGDTGAAEPARRTRAEAPVEPTGTRPSPAAGRPRIGAGDASAQAEGAQRAERKVREKAEREAREAAERETRRRAREIGAARERLAQAEKVARTARQAADAAQRQAESARGRAERAERAAADRRRELDALLRGP